MKVMGIVKPVTYVHKFKVHLTKLTSMHACLLSCQNDMTNVWQLASILCFKTRAFLGIFIRKYVRLIVYNMN